MRQRHPAGERLFVDYAGHTVDVICPQTGEVRTAQIFVAALGASNLTYVEATWTQSLPDWISSHVRAFAFLGGVPAQVVPDNLKAAVIKACFHDPAINRTYGDMAAHYDTAVVPARPRKPKDKAKVEGAVLLAERWILARLRNQTFFSLDELNAAIRPLRDQLNNKVTRHLGASRRNLFETLDKPALKPLPAEPYVYAEGSVYKSYAWASDCGGEAGAWWGVLQFKALEPSQVVVEIFGCDASVAPQEILQLAVSIVDRLNVKDISHPLPT